MSFKGLLFSASSLALQVTAQTNLPFSLPIGAANTSARADAIRATRQNFTYGPDIVGTFGAYYPNINTNGSLASQIVTKMESEYFPEQINWTAQVEGDAAVALQIIAVSDFSLRNHLLHQAEYIIDQR